MLKRLLGKEFSGIKFPIIGENISLSGDINGFLNAFESQQWEYDCIQYLSEIIRPGQIILDVGAWIGVYSILFSKLTGDTGYVYSFEPNPKVGTKLKNNLRKNHIKNVSVIGQAVSDAIGEAKLYPCNVWNDSMSNLIGRRGQCKDNPINVKTVTLDRFCNEFNATPNGIKIDVEGVEAQVIKGSREILRKYSPWVFIEFHGEFMTDQECEDNWNSIIELAKSVTFISGKNSSIKYGSQLSSFPDCQYFHVIVNY